jgi:hypothetical protein
MNAVPMDAVPMNAVPMNAVPMNAVPMGAVPNAAAMSAAPISAPSAPSAAVQLAGRTEGDLIVVFDAPAPAPESPDRTGPEALVGTIIPVRIESSGPLILRGRAVPV